jgi:hypothetical protein
MRITRTMAVAGAMFLCVAPHPGFAQGPVALVEDVTGNPAGVGFMDYVDAGKVIQLGARDSIVLSYIQSCMRETIKGGTVTIGAQQSDVQSGQVQRAKVQCDAGKMMQTPPQSMAQAAGVVFRSLGPKPGAGTAPKADATKQPQPQFVLYGLSPVLQVSGAGEVTIKRVDGKTEPEIKLSIAESQLMKGAFFDTATKGVSLAGGGTYRVTWGDKQTVFKVDPAAKPGRAPIIQRLVRLVPAT